MDLNKQNGNGQQSAMDRRTGFNKDQEQGKSSRLVPIISTTSICSASSASNGMSRSNSSNSIASLSPSQKTNDLQIEHYSSTGSEDSDLSIGSEEQEDTEELLQLESSGYPDDICPDDEPVGSSRGRASLRLQSRRSSESSEEGNSWDIISEYNKALSPPLSPVEESELDIEIESEATTFRPSTLPESTSTPSVSSSPVLPRDSLEVPANTEPLTKRSQTKSKDSMNQFKSMMDDLVNEIKSLPKRNHPVVVVEAGESQETMATAPIPAPLRIKGVRRSDDIQKTTTTTTSSTSTTPAQPRTTHSLLPPPKPKSSRLSQDIRRITSPTPGQPGVARRSEDDRNTPSPTPGQQKVLCRADDTRRPTSPAPASTPGSSPGPVPKRIVHRSESTRTPLPPGVVPPRDARRSIDSRRSTSPPTVQTSVTQRVEDVKRDTRRPVDVRSPTSPSTIQTSVIHHIEEPRRSTSPFPTQTKVNHRIEGIQTTPTPAATQPKPVRRSDDMRNPPPPSPEQPPTTHRCHDLQPQRSIREPSEKPARAPERECRTERIVVHERSEPREREIYYEREVQAPPSRIREREPARERGRDMIHTERIERVEKVVERTEKVDKLERVEKIERIEKIHMVEKNDKVAESVREHEASMAPPTRSRSKGARGSLERCADCKQEILPSEVADSVKMNYGSYHLECLKCSHCRCPLESASDAHEYEGRVMCEDDFVRMIGLEIQRPQRFKTCAGCEGPIQSNERIVYALDKPWHEHHLCCYHCLRSIPVSVGHVEKDGRIYCPKDYKELFTPRCRGCGLMVEKDTVCAQDGKLKGKWHASCFRCTTCRRPFTDKKFYVFNNAPYCKRHYHRLNNSLCMRCDEPIEGSCIQTAE
ncbi:hypothetical protein BGZ65_003888 [Modicella reniformis]|uniref:LIM zinc-binding domain-containing protein n=1 Tax=Modicella reniformis TaxID=1440133 RepID=A0A9P6M928_9FUNG|nr:hypothetical protein BGZ65_003888 [Modicella reniformis]